MKPEIAAVRFIVPQKDIYYISWIIDAAEGIGFLQTDAAKAGKVTAKKGMRPGKTYTAKVKVTCGKAVEYVKVKVKAR